MSFYATCSRIGSTSGGNDVAHMFGTSEPSPSPSISYQFLPTATFNNMLGSIEEPNHTRSIYYLVHARIMLCTQANQYLINSSGHRVKYIHLMKMSAANWVRTVFGGTEILSMHVGIWWPHRNMENNCFIRYVPIRGIDIIETSKQINKPAHIDTCLYHNKCIQIASQTSPPRNRFYRKCFTWNASGNLKATRNSAAAGKHHRKKNKYRTCNKTYYQQSQNIAHTHVRWFMLGHKSCIKRGIAVSVINYAHSGAWNRSIRMRLLCAYGCKSHTHAIGAFN